MKKNITLILLSFLLFIILYGVNRHQTVQTHISAGADYAEWFEKEGILMPGDVVGINPQTGKVRRYEYNDHLIGVCSANPGFIGDNVSDRTQAEMNRNFALVGLVGKFRINKDQLTGTNGEVRTVDNKRVGFVLNDGRVLLKIAEEFRR